VINDGSLKDGAEARIWGPPGCGKTTYLSRQIARAAEKYGDSSILVTSFTRAAAVELAGRNLPIVEENVGTLHSHCYRALGGPKIAEGEYREWNRKHPGYRLSPVDATVEQNSTEFQETTLGDELYREMQILRAQMVPPERWPERVHRFAKAWSDWKRRARLSDFTDLLEDALQDLKIAPGFPSVIVVDEAQDLSRLQLALLRQWGRHADYLLMAGDDDQTVYGFAGAAPEVLLEHQLTGSFETVLKQSYRVPRAVQQLSEAWIRQVALRQPKQYLPRDAEGEVRVLHRGHYKYPEPVWGLAERYVANGKTVMFLATCGYMLNPLKAVLRARGIPFHNPYRVKRRDWNPMRSAGRILAYLRPRHELAGCRWDAGDLRSWTPWLRSEGVLLDGADQRIAALPPETEITVTMLDQFFRQEVLVDLLHVISGAPFQDCLSWWRGHLNPKKQRAGRYLAAVALRGGVEALTSTPRVIVGTGHSVKGGEADVVFLFPDLSASGVRQWEGPRKDRDTVIRLGYVMMTRARETLVICDPAGAAHMPIAALAGRVRPAIKVGYDLTLGL
jgi:superfamily I DNA/RNA helicase